MREVRETDGWQTGPVVLTFEAAAPDRTRPEGHGDGHQDDAGATVAVPGSERLPLFVMYAVIWGVLIVGMFLMSLRPGQEHPAATPPRPGIVWAWGSNDVGQLGQDHFDFVLNTVRVPELAGVVSVSAGSGHSLALREDGTVWAWGSNKAGQLGDGTKIYRSHPARIPSLDGIVAIASGDFHNVAVAKDGGVWAWGFNGSGQVFGGEDNVHLTPIHVAGLPPAVGVAAGATFSAALTGDGEVWTWGGNSQGAIGRGWIGGAAYAPEVVAGLPRIVRIAAGSQHLLAVDEHGEVWTWGANRGGQLGDGTLKDRSAPTHVEGLADVVDVTGGMYYSLARTRDGQVWAWGRHGLPIDGDGISQLDPHPIPHRVPQLTGSTAIAGGAFEAMVLRDDGSVWGWRVPFPPNGAGFSRLPGFPVQVDGVRDAGAVAVGMGHALIVERKASAL